MAAYTAMDPEGEEITWDVTGTDAEDFTIEGGVLMFNESAQLRDADGRTDDTGTLVVTAADNIHDVTVEASDGEDRTGTIAMVTVTVTVTNVEEPGRGKSGQVAAKAGSPDNSYA